MRWLKAIRDGVWFGFNPLRFTESAWGWAVTLFGILILAGVLVPGAYSLVAPQFESADWKPPLDPTQVGIGALAFVALLFVIATVRRTKRLQDLDSPGYVDYLAWGCESDLQLLRAFRSGIHMLDTYQQYVDEANQMARIDHRVFFRLKPYRMALAVRYKRQRDDVSEIDHSGLSELDDEPRSLELAKRIFEWNLNYRIKNLEEIIELLTDASFNG